MNQEKITNVIKNFDENYLYSLLGDLKDSLIEWTNTHRRPTKKNLAEIIWAINGFSLFDQEDFRCNFILSNEDDSFLKKVAQLCDVNYNGKTEEHIKLAKKFSLIAFGNQEIYRYIINEYLENIDYQFKKNEKENPTELIKQTGKKFYELYDYQYMIKQQAMNDLSNKEKDLYRILIHMPTGTGKTKTTMHIISQYLNFVTKGKGLVIWVAHSNELLMQAYETFQNVWSHLATFDINIYKGWVNVPDVFNDGILFISVKALQEKYGKTVFKELSNKASLIVFDEVHKAGAKITSKCIDELMKGTNTYGKKLIGLTATPGRTTEMGRENLIFSESFDHIIGIDVDRINAISLSPDEVRNYSGSKEPIKYFQENGYLAVMNKELLNYEVDPEVVAELKKEFKSDKEKYSDKLIEKISLNISRNNKIIEKLQRLNDNKIPTIVFACSLQHAKLLSAFLKLQNIQNSLIYGEMSTSDRIRAIDDFKNGVVNIIINYEILTTGFDSTNIKCVFITSPTKSVIKYSQMIGRGLRGPKMGGNKECLLIDVQENSLVYTENKAFGHFDNYWN